MIIFVLFVAENKFFSFLRDKIVTSDNDNNFNIVFITAIIRFEYNICGIRSTIFKEPLLINNLCIVLSVKKNPLIVKYKEKDKISKNSLIEVKL